MLAYLVTMLFTILLNFGDGSCKEIYTIFGEDIYIHLVQNRNEEWKCN